MKLIKLLFFAPIILLSACSTDDLSMQSNDINNDSPSSEPTITHEYEEISYSWNTDHTSLTATRVCIDDASLTETETVEVDISITKNATCVETGTRLYTSKVFNNPLFTQKTYEETIPALGHSFSVSLEYVDNDHHGHKCERCDEVTGLDDHNYDVIDLVYAHDNGTAFPDPGEITYECIVCHHQYSEPYYQLEGVL